MQVVHLGFNLIQNLHSKTLQMIHQSPSQITKTHQFWEGKSFSLDSILEKLVEHFYIQLQSNP